MKASRNLYFVSIPLLAMLIFAAGWGTAGAASTNSTPGDPILVPGNPTCLSLGYDFGFKPQPEPPPSGTYTFPDGINTVTLSSDGTYFDWVSTLGIDAVIVKGGNNANSYVYDPPAEAYSGSGLHSPANSSGGYANISHIEFCYDYEVTVSKTANTTFTRTFDWTIEKSVTPEVLDMFTGDSGTVLYTVAVTKTGFTDSDWAVNGVITIDNDTPYDATITSVADSISGLGAVTPSCGVSFPYTLPAWGTLACTYETALPDGFSRVNTATVATTGTVGGGSATADIIFGAPTTLVNDTINVGDTNGGSWEFGDSGSTTYEATFTCDADEGIHGNTATIVETGQSDSASVTVNCYALDVTKDANTSLTRTWNWTIDKTADQTDLLLMEGQLFQVNYEVEVSAVSTDSDWLVEGQILVSNATPLDAVLTGVSDVVSPAIGADVDCGVTFPYTLLAGESLTCDYSADLPDDMDRTNTATATLQNVPSGTTDFTGSAAVDFSAAVVTEVDECIDVSDTNTGVLGTVCASDAPQTFSYSLWFGAHPDADVELVCGPNTHTNIASFETNDTGTPGSDDWTVNAEVTCGYGCTLTQGYWKTHSSYGPAPYDDTWAMLPNGANTLFFNTGKTWYEVFWTAPAGNSFYNLAHQYMAAKLNILNGASQPAEVFSALAAADAIFGGLPAGSTTIPKNQRAIVLSLAATLDHYNNGLIGPGHCSE